MYLPPSPLHDPVLPHFQSLILREPWGLKDVSGSVLTCSSSYLKRSRNALARSKDDMAVATRKSKVKKHKRHPTFEDAGTYMSEIVADADSVAYVQASIPLTPGLTLRAF